MIRQITATQAKAVLHGTQEVAFLDLREAGPYSEGHPLFATHCPFSLLEGRIGVLVPRLTVAILLIDGGDGIAEVGAQALLDMGYRDIRVVQGGTPAWADTGHTLYQGVNVPSKTLGELVEHISKPAMIDPAALARWQEEGRHFAFFDCRPAPEFSKMTVPGAVCLPNGELAHRLAAIESDGPIVLTCAGRTRGVIGAAGLSMICPERQVYALENGTQGWRLAGYDLALNNDPAPFPEMTQAAADTTRRVASDLLAARNIASIDADAVAKMRADPDRTTFLIDVRSAQEAAQDPLRAFAHALSGQLVQATDQWIGVRHSRVVLADDLGLRAGLAAFWLRLLGFETFVTEVNDALRALPVVHGPDLPRAWVDVCTAQSALDIARAGQGVLLDVRSSSAFTTEHATGARWVIRPELSQLSRGMRYLLIGDYGPRADLAAQEMARLGHPHVAVIDGGHSALKRAGASVTTAPSMPLSQAIDVTSFADGRHDGDLDASRLYLAWEMGLVAQLDEAERAEFLL